MEGRLADAAWELEIEQRRRGMHPDQRVDFEARRADGKPMVYAADKKPNPGERPMDYEHIFDAIAKRAGGRITIYGKTREGNARRVVGVDQIAVEGNRFIATDKDGNKYVLSLQPR